MCETNESHSRSDSDDRFLVRTPFVSQYFPQCVKYLLPELRVFWTNSAQQYICNECVLVKEGFIAFSCDFYSFNLDCVMNSTPEDLDVYARCVSAPSLALLLKDRWYKGDMYRLKQILQLNSYTKIVAFIDNCIWERSYEDYYTLGQQLSIRMTTNLIQSGLDFKHHVSKEKNGINRGWNCVEFEKLLANITSMADITKRYKCNATYVMLEIDGNNAEYTMSLLSQHFGCVMTNNLLKNVCAIKKVGVNKESVKVVEQLRNMIASKLVNVLFVTDTENYLHTHNIFYVYNSMKFYYYCIKNKFVFDYADYETLYLLYTIVVLEIINGGSLNSFTLEKSSLMHPLELNSRRCNALKRAAAYNKTLSNDMELKVDFVRGKRISTGSHNPNRIVELI
ncbi:P47 [Erinnyis ello granulovirus]|uniref:p47 n=1 Tax=Erinnyis ello granulovirus TaxID=307444 RepID=A0A097DAN2_9BBAC|nr:P47 [Erinnyis ello granulovirus]AIS92060.1 P47 [Erinnyis ello granulovirus]ARX71400.1 p47 [Erinnyis ello granulovirus]ARX71530.1 p47 [Erinnyis ello granulovirus]ARX71660.1 p47 [Erinnyis ello granulovirus]ARX71790.1 p47 [Erinnyis ello granulovirus]